MRHLLPLITLLLLSLTGFSQIEFRDVSYADALRSAASEDKYLLVDFRADWCKPCIDMEKTTFQDSTLSSFVNQHLVPLKLDIDIEANKRLANLFKVNAYPTLLLIDPSNGVVLLRMIGYKPAKILLGDLKFALPGIDVPDTK